MFKRFLLLAALAVAIPTATHALTADHRLGGEARPTAESVTLQLDPARHDYTGSVRIELKVPAVTDSFQLHARGLRLSRVELQRSSKTFPLSFAADSFGVLTIRTQEPIRAGEYRLEIEFASDFGTRTDGLYRVVSGGDAYLFTQFEATEARAAFPCFDEPGYKIPWNLTLEVPESLLAVSNMPIASEAVVGDRRRVAFRRTPPMPSYLVAMAVGPFETVPIPGMSVPGRVITTKGATRLTAEAVKWTPKILTALERYFGRRYPYPKLDLLAVPEFWAGAMENAGAITFRDRILLLDPAAVTADERRRLISITAHELSHMWFGDLVTLNWWDDFWLNESFASWMGNKISDQVAPELGIAVSKVRGRQRAMTIDARPSAHAVRQPVDGRANVDQLADALTYEKGQAILEMLEQWIGPPAFRQGVQRYLTSHAWNNAVGADLWDALSKAAHRDVSGPTRSFLEQPGVPLVSVERAGLGQIRLRQRRFLNVGDHAQGSPLWQIPVSLKYSDGSSIHTQTVLLDQRERTVTLDSKGSLVWLYPNADARGYYRWQLDSGMLMSLPQIAMGDLSAREKVDYVGNLAALLEGGQLAGDQELRLLERFARDSNPEVVSAVLDALERSRTALITPDVAPGFASYVRRTLRPALAAIGTTPAAGESDATALLRPRLMLWLGRYGDDSSVIERGRELARAYLANPASVDPSLVDAALELAAIGGDAELLETYEQHFEHATLPAERVHFLGALCGFRDTALVARVLRYTLTGPLRPQDFMTVIRGLAQREENAGLLFAWATKNYEVLAARMPRHFVHALTLTAGTCSQERLEQARAFFGDPAHWTPGTDQDLARLGDQVAECAELRARDGQSVARYLDGMAAKE